MFHNKYPTFIKIIMISTLSMFSACQLFDFRSDHTLLAKAYNSRLYLEDMQDLIPKGLNPADSTAFIRQYVDTWTMNQVFLFHATQVLNIEQTAIEQRVKDYQNALVMHKYESYLVREEMDTVITQDQLENYYEKNKAYFTLKDHIVHVNYVKLPLASNQANQIRARYRSNKPEILDELEEICLYHAATYYIGKENWMLLSDITKDMPLNINDPATFLSNNKFAEITDDYFRYFLYIHDYKLSGDQSPLQFERNNVKRFILNHRKKQFVQKMRQDLFNQAIEANRIEIYF